MKVPSDIQNEVNPPRDANRDVASGDAASGDAAKSGQGPSGSWMLTGQLSENASSQTFVIKNQRLAIGRHLENDLCISNPSVSGRHAEIVLSQNEVFVRDLGSTNGTLLNGRQIKSLVNLKDGDILHFGSAMFTLRAGDQNPATDTVATSAAEDAIAQVQFDRLITKPAVQPYYQPIVRLSDGVRIGYEVLSRSRLVGLETPAKMFRVAAQRTSEAELSTVCRSEALRALPALGSGMQYYLNTHPKEIGTPELLDSLTELREHFPTYSCVLEVHESAIASLEALRELRQHLLSLNMGLAYDDFGSGQARLAELSEVPPDVVKFDIKLIRDLDSASYQRRATIESLVRMVLDLDVVPLAEGVETDKEHQICRDIGFLYGQGFLYGKPAAADDWVRLSETVED